MASTTESTTATINVQTVDSAEITNIQDSPKVSKIQQPPSSSCNPLNDSNPVQKKEENKGIIREPDNTYRSKCSGELISNFALEVKEVLVLNGKEIYRLKAITDKGEIIELEISSEQFANTSTFKKAVSRMELVFVGNEKDVQYIKLLINVQSRDCKKITGVSRAGIHEIDGNNIYVDEFAAINAKNEFDETVILIKKPELLSITSSLTQSVMITKQELMTIMHIIFKINTFEKMATLIGCLVAIFYKHHFNKIGKAFPHILVFGESGGGKSSTIELFKNLFGMSEQPSVEVDKLTKISCMAMFASSNLHPVILEEYKPSKLSKSIKSLVSDILRSAYNLFSGLRGKSDLSIVSYNFLAPCILLGEESISERAVIERSVEILLSRMDRTDETKKYYEQMVEKKGLLTKLGKSILLHSLSVSPEEVNEEFERSKSYILTRKPELRDRALNNLAIVLTGLALLDKTLKKFELDLPHIIAGYSWQIIYDKVINMVTEYTLSGQSNYSAVENTLMILDRMACNGILTEGEDYRFCRVNGVEGMGIAFRMQRVYAKFLKYTKVHGEQADIITSQDAFTKQLRKTVYFEAYTNQLFTVKGEDNQYSLKAFVIKLDKCDDSLDLVKFVGPEKKKTLLDEAYKMNKEETS